MEFAIKITNPNAKDIELKKKEETTQTIITNVTVKLDTLDNNTRRKTDSMLARVKIEGVINADTMKDVAQLFKWSTGYDKDSIYRNVEIHLTENDDEIRDYILEDMFVVDYQEDLKRDDSKEPSTFTLEMNQKETSSNKISSTAYEKN